ncbi:type IV pilin N-terminal domain-containing protein [Halosolutus halophilus]|uniref:type IV pilin N-terminal domain-containing protein n=1 Tax=Halosolutus halophilus TaxID=1552990 RepID=UPI0031F2E1AC
MVAITVILAAVIAGFVLDLGGGLNENANAGVDFDVDNSNNEITVTVASMGNSDHIELRGDADTSKTLDKVGSSVTLTGSDRSSSSGTITAVAITEDGTETQVSSQDYNFPEAPEISFSDDTTDDEVDISVSSWGDANSLTVESSTDTIEISSGTSSGSVDVSSSGEEVTATANFDDSNTEVGTHIYDN